MRCNLCDNRTQNEQIFVPGNNFLDLHKNSFYSTRSFCTKFNSLIFILIVIPIYKETI